VKNLTVGMHFDFQIQRTTLLGFQIPKLIPVVLAWGITLLTPDEVPGVLSTLISRREGGKVLLQKHVFIVGSSRH
jgi:hypothetical protein